MVLLVLVAISGFVVWGLTRPVNLTVTDGSVTGRITGDFPHVTNTLTPLVDRFKATSFANETDHPMSSPAAILSLEVTTYSFTDGSTLIIDLNFTIRGTFASDLRLHDLQVGVNGTGQTGHPFIFPSYVWSTNVSYNFTRSFPTLNPPTSFALVNQPANGPPYEFQVTGLATVELMDYSVANSFGFRAVVDGQITPAVGVGVTVETVYTP